MWHLSMNTKSRDHQTRLKQASRALMQFSDHLGFCHPFPNFPDNLAWCYDLPFHTQFPCGEKRGLKHRRGLFCLFACLVGFQKDQQGRRKLWSWRQYCAYVSEAGDIFPVDSVLCHLLRTHPRSVGLGQGASRERIPKVDWVQEVLPASSTVRHAQD